MVAALLNISIPLELGQLINSVAQLESGREAWHYLTQLSPAATRLLTLYALQVSHFLPTLYPFSLCPTGHLRHWPLMCTLLCSLCLERGWPCA